jgi:glycosyltransferase involved in cell wall biosynthesis
VIRSVPKAVYLIVGDGICLEEMKAQCRSSGVLDHFRFVGWVDHEAVPRYLNLADVVLMPSESEAAALVYLETQACAKVLIASDIAGAREIVRDGETGLLFRMGEVGDLTGRILLAAGDPELRDRIGHAGHEWVKARDIQRFVADYERVLLELVERYQRATRSAR